MACLNSHWCAGLRASSSLSIISIPDTSMSRRVETDAVALTGGERILGEGSSSGACQELLNGKLAEIGWENGV